MRKLKTTLIFSIVILCAIQLLHAQKTILKHWDFYLEKSPNDIKSVTIPHTWNATDAFDDTPGYYRGKGIYTTELEISEVSKKYYITFNGANQQTTLFVNNEEVGSHDGGYTAFSFDITSYIQKGKNNLKVEVDNTHNETIPPLDADFTFYGGIYRNVFLETKNPIHFKKELGTDVVKLDAIVENGNGILNINTKIKNLKDLPSVVNVFIRIKSENNDLIINELKEINLTDKTNTFTHTMYVKNPLLWSPNSPNLYEAQLILRNSKGEILDEYYHYIGFKTIEIDTENGFVLNGKPLKLTGVNRHQDWERLGNAVSLKLQIQDLVAIKAMGSNFLRLAHYPQAKEIYRAADSLGLILWSEIPVVNKVPIGKDYDLYEKKSIIMQQEHMLQNYNHTSLVFVGYMNEIFLRMVFDKPNDSEKEKIIKNTLKLAQKLEDITRKEMPNHITVMALHGHQIYNDTQIADIPMVIGWNLYYGWYEGKTNDLGGFLDNEYKKYPKRPLIISEYGVGADIRLHTETPQIFDFTEEYQLKYHQDYWKQVHERPFVIGMTAWNFADFGSEFRGNSMPHVNQKGLVNFDRSPKNIYYWYKAVMKPDEDVFKIYNDYDIHLNTSSEKTVKIISNRKTILKVNGEKLAKKRPENGIVSQKISLQEGQNSIEVYNEEAILKDEKIIIWKKPELKRVGDILAINFGANEYFKDSENTLWIPYSNTLENIQIKGNTNSIKTSANIQNTNDDSVYQSALSGIENITIDNIANGEYKVKILLASLKKIKNSAYNLGKENNNVQLENQNFEIKINAMELEYIKGKAFQKTEKSTIVMADKNKIDIVFTSEETPTFINGLYIEKLN